MQKRELAWIVVLLLMVGAYIHFFSNWGEKREIRVVATIRPALQGRRRGPPVAVTNASPFRVVFELDAYYKLTSLDVIQVDRQHTNDMKQDLWHLVSKSNSAPVKVFQYGQVIKGLEPDIEGAQPEPLAPGAIYRMEVSAGRLKGVSAPFAIPDVRKPDDASP